MYDRGRNHGPGQSRKTNTQRGRIGSKKPGTTRESDINDKNQNQIMILITPSFLSMAHTEKRLTRHQPNLENILIIYQKDEK